jgi:hypothetical protein
LSFLSDKSDKHTEDEEKTIMDVADHSAGLGTLARQALGRPLTSAEAALATALESIFGSGIHDFSKVAQLLQQQGVAKPSGSTTPWDLDSLQAEFAMVNASLDQAYDEAGTPREPAAGSRA